MLVDSSLETGLSYEGLKFRTTRLQPTSCLVMRVQDRDVSLMVESVGLVLISKEDREAEGIDISLPSAGVAEPRGGKG